jgi:ABC-type sugar transport system substrate-binding protein
VPKGRTAYYIYTSSPIGAITEVSAQQAAQTLGWTFKPLGVQSDPVAFQQGFKTALNDPATSAIISTAVAVSAVSTQLQQAAAKHIPVAIIQPDADSSNDLISIAGPAAYRYVGKLEADYMLAKTQGRAQLLLVIPAAFPTNQILANSFSAEWAKMCPKCQAPQTYEAPLTSFGKNFPTLLTAYLQAHRSVSRVVFGFDDMMIGVPGALQAAGLTDVKALTWAQGPEINALIGGFAQATVANPLLEFPWVAFDAVLRALDHQSTAQDAAFYGPGSPEDWFITKAGMRQAGLDPSKTWPIDPNYLQEFKQLWGLTR